VSEDIVTPTWATVRALKEENQRLREELEALRETSLTAREAQTVRLMLRLKQPRIQATILGRLWRGRNASVVTIAQLMSALYGDNPNGVDDKIVPVYVCKIRRQFGRDCILTVHGTGYKLAAEFAAQLTDILQDATPARAA